MPTRFAQAQTNPPSAAAASKAAPVHCTPFQWINNTCPLAIGTPSINGVPLAPQALGFKPGHILLTDNFLTLNPDWCRASSMNFVRNGAFEIEPPAGQEFKCLNSTYALTNVDAAVSITASGTTQRGNAAGLAIGVDGDQMNSFIEVLIDPVAGEYTIFSYAHGKTTTLVDWTSDDSINTSSGASNRLELIANSEHVLLIVNGHPVAWTKTPLNLNNTFLALAASAPNKTAGDFRFTHLVVKQPQDPIQSPVATAPAVSPGQTIYSDNFQTLDPSWGFANQTLSVASGQLRNALDPNSVGVELNDKYKYGSMDESVDVVAAPGDDPTANGGLAFWGTDSNNFTYLVVTPKDQTFAVYQFKDGSPLALISAKTSNAINVSDGAVNRLEVALRADKAYLFVNGQSVGELPTPAGQAEGLAGLLGADVGSATSTVCFSNFSVTAPLGPGPPKGTAAPPASTSPPCPSPPPPAPLASGFKASQTIFTDNFQTRDPAWGADDASSAVQNGAMEFKPSVGQEYRRYSKKYALKEMDAGVTVAASSATQAGGAAGLAISDAGSLTNFLIDPVAGQYAIYSIIGAKQTPMVDWQADNSINVAPGVRNRIEIITTSTQTRFLVNGHPVATIATRPSLPGSLLGLVADSPDKSPGNYRFTDLVVKEPPQDLPSLATAAPSASPGQTIFSDNFQTLDPSWGFTNSSLGAADGQLRNALAPQQSSLELNDKYAYGPTDESVDVAVAKGDDPAADGALVFWGIDSNDFTYFYVTPKNQTFAVVRVKNHAGAFLINPKRSNAINASDGATNFIEVALRADKAYFFVNGQNIGDLPAASGVAGSLAGLLAENTGAGASTICFSNFSVAAPSGSGPPSGTAVASTTPTPKPCVAPPPPPSKTTAAAPPPAAASSAPSSTNAAAAPAAASPLIAPPAPASSPAASSAAPTTSATASPPSASSTVSAPPLPAPPASGATNFAQSPLIPPPASPPSVSNTGPPPAPAPGPGEIVALADNFQTFSQLWGKPNNSIFVQNGALVVQLAGASVLARLNTAYRYYDADISFDGEVTSGPASSGVDLVFWLQDPQHYYYLFVGADGVFRVTQVSGTAVTPIVPPQTSPAIKGVGQWNAIQLSIRGNAATLSVNGVTLVQFAGNPPLFGGAVGLSGAGGAGGPSTIEFANFQVAVPAPAHLTLGPANVATAAPVRAPVSSGNTPVLEDDFSTFDPSWGHAAGIVSVANGNLAELAANGAVSGTVNSRYLYDDADIRFNLQLQQTAQLADTVASLFFWISKGAADQYIMSVSPAGYVCVFHRIGNQTQSLTQWVQAASFKPGVGQINVIDVSLRGNQGSVSVNGRAVTQFSGTAPADGGEIGLAMLASKSGASSWDFSKLQVWVPASAAAEK